MKVYRLLVLTLFVFLIGCENNILDTFPVDELSNELFWESERDAISAANAVYNFLPGVGEIQWDMLSDIGHTNNPANFRQAIESGEHDSSLSFFANLWNGHYQGIRRANYFLENVDQILENDPVYTNELNNRLKAEVRVIRALLYMRLSFWFGDIPLITETITPEEGAAIAETSRDQIVDFIFEELSEVASDLPLEYPSSDIGRITRGAAYALLARSMIYNNRWQETAEAAQAVMDLRVHSLNDSFESLFDYESQNTAEIILDRQYSRGTVSHNYFSGYAPQGMNGNVGLSPTRILADAFQTINGLSIEEDPEFDEFNPYANRDPRLGYTLFLPAFSDEVAGDILFNGQEYDPRPGSGTADEIERDLNRTKTGFNTKKYINPDDLSDPTNNGTNFILIRYADVLLMYAEAKIELNDIDESVYSAINEVRTRPDVGMPTIPEGLSQEELREIVRNERMVEFGMEGLRFWDIRRWRIAEDVMQGNIPGMRYIESGGSEIQTFTFGGTTRAFNPNRDYLFPIPAQELVINQNLTQNPGY
jgi:starch-binding outer membrane protein, SusD/RagB family